ncbi:phage tail sheath subtilisin-like domain-containing protein [Alkaliphilus sp. B6464]|uniref:phage tail sheath subtilisin-like domain-containing protein n=1 Tax=Alkaliphilus sp. B6464 TaxID=2731219 RepID=UPI001BAA640C|nr:phage tail sheath subtilisin-like domain-containing protein [Alkaliphilus sp. B6464]QUH21421.1 phage tail sheath subtilisin-like domain-containing protein [Alkaliphilus sp. B6464]
MGARWESQNKGRPGVYSRNTSEDMDLSQVSDRGVCALPLKLNWGEKGFIQIVNGENLLKKIGYSITDQEVFPIKEAFKNARIIYLYNVAEQGKKSKATEGELIAEAKYEGIRGNDITVVIEKNLDDSYQVIITLGTIEVEKQNITTIKEFKSDFITLSGTLQEVAGLKLTGGETGTVTNESYIQFLEAVEREVGNINAIGYPGTEEPIKELFVSFINRIRDEVGYKIQCVLSEYPEADHEAIYSVKNGVVMGASKLTSAECVPYVLGAVAGARINESLTYHKYKMGATNVTGELQNEDIKKALLKGEVVFTMSRDGNVVIEQDVTTLKSLSKERPKALRKGRPSRALDNFDGDIDKTFYTYYIGKEDNDEAGRAILKNEIYKLAKKYEELGAFQNTTLEDFEIFEGDDIDSVFIRYAVQPVDSVDKIYIERVIK